ncbi:MAG TPA: 4-hydroxy-tetrahydrodipicolinate synthase [Candidatus Dormibacteraeota bacterium]|jgi:4-hydroxy-tetrahydrodipicolinate synthase
MSRPEVDLGRVLTAMITPFDKDGGLDLAGAERMAHLLVENGNDGVVVAGTTGESPTLSHSEKLELFRAVRAAIPAKVVVAGTGSNDTMASIQLSQEAEKLGVTAVMAVVPYYNKPPQKSLYAHFSAIAGAIDGALMLYNVPTRTIANLAPETAIRLSQVDNIVALKEANPDVSQCAAICAGMAPGFRVYSGEDSLTLSMMSVGAHGVVSVAGHFAATGIRAMIEYFLMGDSARAMQLQHRLMPIFKEVFCTASPIPVKALYNSLGFDVGGTRLPLVMDEITPEQLQNLRRIVADLGSIELGDIAVQLSPPVAATA